MKSRSGVAEGKKQFEDIKGVMNEKMDRQYNDQKKKQRSTKHYTEN
jgi:hypothetical protein